MSAAVGYGLARAIQGLAAGGTQLLEGLQRNEASRAKSLYNAYMEDKIQADALDAERMDMGLPSVREVAQKDPIAAATILSDRGLKPAAILPFDDWKKHSADPAPAPAQVTQAPVAQPPAQDPMAQALAASSPAQAQAPQVSEEEVQTDSRAGLAQQMGIDKFNTLERSIAESRAKEPVAPALTQQPAQQAAPSRSFEGKDALVGVLGQKPPATIAAESDLRLATARLKALIQSKYPDKEAVDMAREAVKSAREVLKDARDAGNDVTSRKVDVGQGFQTQEGMDYRQGNALASAKDLQDLRLKFDAWKTKFQEAGKNERLDKEIEADYKSVNAEAQRRLDYYKERSGRLDRAFGIYTDPKVPVEQKIEALEAAEVPFVLENKIGNDRDPTFGKPKIKSADFVSPRKRIDAALAEVTATHNQLRKINFRKPAIEGSDTEASPNADYIPDTWKEETPAEKPKGKAKGFLDPSRPR